VQPLASRRARGLEGEEQMVLMPVFYVWVAVTVLLMVVWYARKRLEAREQDWLPLSRTTDAEIRQQQEIEVKLHKLTPVVRGLGALNVVLLLVMVGLWVYEGINSVRW
jgi:hypothetical protein